MWDAQQQHRRISGYFCAPGAWQGLGKGRRKMKKCNRVWGQSHQQTHSCMLLVHLGLQIDPSTAWYISHFSNVIQINIWPSCNMGHKSLHFFPGIMSFRSKCKELEKLKPANGDPLVTMAVEQMSVLSNLLCILAGANHNGVQYAHVTLCNISQFVHQLISRRLVDVNEIPWWVNVAFKGSRSL